MNGRQSGHKDSNLQQGDLKDPISPLLLLWVPDRGHCFGIRQQKSVQGAKWKGSLGFRAEKHGGQLGKRGFIMYVKLEPES